MKKIAIVLFNLGGPDTQKAVQPFLFNLFQDPAIIRVPQPFRFLIAKIISSKRAPIARAIYEKIGGGSPLLENTKQQAQALENELNLNAENTHRDALLFKTFISMRYWHPFASEAIKEVKDFAPDEIVLLPLYPQFSTTTTKSSLASWALAAYQHNVQTPTKTICCYPRMKTMIKTLSSHLQKTYAEAMKHGKPRVLFSAHGLPEKIVKAGDPYHAHCLMTVEGIKQEAHIENLDSVLCFQSRVGPLQWLSPSTDDEIRLAGSEKRPIVIVPISFVSDHSETLVEIDIEYRHLALQSGASFFERVPVVGVSSDFIKGLAQLIYDVRLAKKDCVSETGGRLCSPEYIGCMCSI